MPRASWTPPPPPIPGLELDGGAQVVDVALLVGPHKVAVLCDGPARCSRSGPHEAAGYWAAAGRVLEASGWRVLRLPWAEWRALGDPEAQLMHVHNAFMERLGILL